ncbi:hypothetical protein llap_20276 [Limosa lapponica baueri]|uniref:Uncharacterized protein n=1 Tax=Limosa lapponica baueri TaxID=1758121 RepID=A0A2I0T6K5_LIMLA|nr:hypothetical protein llap_20276 [Limosa lapponica baueri]
MDENEFIDASRLVYDGIRDIRKAVLMIRNGNHGRGTSVISKLRTYSPRIYVIIVTIAIAASMFADESDEKSEEELTTTYVLSM